MAKREMLLLCSAALLMGCAPSAEGSSAASSSSNESSSVTSFIDDSAFEIAGQGDIAISAKGLMDTNEFDIEIDVNQATFDFLSSMQPEGLADLLDYSYYQVTETMTHIAFESAALVSKNGRSKLTYEFEGSSMNLYSKESDLYAELSAVDISETGVAPQNYRFNDAFAFLKDEELTQYTSLLSLVNIDVSTLTSVASGSPDVEDAISMVPYDDDNFKLTFALTEKSVNGLMKQLDPSMEEGALANISFREGSSVSAVYDAVSSKISRILLDAGLSYSFGEQAIDADLGGQTMTINEIGFSFNGALSWGNHEPFELPDLSGYVDYSSEETPADSSAA